jgi:hypothetical protein
MESALPGHDLIVENLANLLLATNNPLFDDKQARSSPVAGMRKQCIASKRNIDAGDYDYQPFSSPQRAGNTDSTDNTATTGKC